MIPGLSIQTIQAEYEVSLVIEPEPCCHVSDGEIPERDPTPLPAPERFVGPRAIVLPTARCGMCHRRLAVHQECPDCGPVLRETRGAPLDQVLARLSRGDR